MIGDAGRAARTARAAARRVARERGRAPVPVDDDLDPPPKLVPSVRELVATGVSVFHTRIALAGIELEEEIQRLIQAAIFGVVGAIFAFLGIVVGTFAIVAAVAPEHQLTALIIITLLYFGIGVVGFLRVKSLFDTRPPIFGATFAELEKDKETLSQMVRAWRVGDAVPTDRTSAAHEKE